MPIMRLRGAGVDEAHVEDAKYHERERIFQQYIKEWEYCIPEGDDEEGRPLHPDPEPYTEGDIDTQDWNHDGLNPGPEVWRNPGKEAIRRGFTIDPWTAPIRMVMDEVAKMAKEATEEEERIHFEGPHLLPNQLPPNPWGDRYVYWDRDEGTRPWPNFRRELPPGYFQLRMCGSCVILRPDRTFIHTDDPDNHDPRTWGQQPEDRGVWEIDAPTYEESKEVTLIFHDEEKTEIVLKRNQQNHLAGQKTFYTGEIPHLDEEVGEIPANLFEGRPCDGTDCPTCQELVDQEEQDEADEMEKLENMQWEGPEDPWTYAEQCLPKEPPLDLPLWYDP